MTKRPYVALFVALFCCAAAYAATEPVKVGSTLQNLQAAFNGESNAHARYVAFAQKADEEGYASVASLFRAAARAEEIHASNHAVVIKKLGGTPEAKIEKPSVKSTKENLEAAQKGEIYERDQMYPAFLKKAREDGDTDAIQTFNYAKTAEAEHARLYGEDLKTLATLKGAAKKNYFVCGTCGYTVTKIDFAKCPSCFSPKEKYEQVS
jgi:rubrerythrin